MSNGSATMHTLREHRPLLLACEAIGWLHMAGKAHPDFLRAHGGAGVQYDDLRWFQHGNPPLDWDNKLAWVKSVSGNIPPSQWRLSLTEFLTKHRSFNSGMLGLLQAAHGMASGIEKNIPTATSEYLKQDTTHLWLTTAFGHPLRNLLADPPNVLQPGAWDELLKRIAALLDELEKLGTNPPADVQPWWMWRERAIGEGGWLRRAFESTLAETRLPNNDVTLWDQSYVAAALFKSAVAGAVLTGSGCEWGKNPKPQTRWRVLTVGFGTRHYEARAVRIGDWVGAQRDVEKFFDSVRKLIEVDLAVGSLVYQDDEMLAFTFPGLRQDKAGSLGDREAQELRNAIEQEVDSLASNLKLETPPVCQLSDSTRSFVPMVQELRRARATLAVPVHRSWTVPTNGGAVPQGARHVCPVCLVRLNGPPHSAQTDNARKSAVCAVCRERRRGRLDAWLAGGGDTIWISEVADSNDRVALLSLSLGLEPWLDGTHVDSLRAQSIAEWRRFNPILLGKSNPIDPRKPFKSSEEHIKRKLPKFHRNYPVLQSLQEGYQHESDWPTFFQKIVEDRAQAPAWGKLNDDTRAAWLAHQLFCKLPSPGRVYRFWRTGQTFFDDLFQQFREIASAHPNRWRTRRLALAPDDASPNARWEDRETYAGRWRDAPLEVLYRGDQRAFVTISNLARGLNPTES